MIRSSEVHSAASLETTYSTGVSASVSGECANYDTLLLYLSVSAINAAGVARVTVEFSPDSTNFYTAYGWQNESTPLTTVLTLTATGDYRLYYPHAGAYYRVTIAYVSGTSVVIDHAAIEVKS